MVGFETFGPSFEADGESVVGVYILALPFLFRNVLIRLKSHAPCLYRGMQTYHEITDILDESGG